MKTIAVVVAILCACVSGELLSATPVINLAEKNVEKTAEQVKGEEFEADKAEEDENDEEDEDDEDDEEDEDEEDEEDEEDGGPGGRGWGRGRGGVNR